jgi:hypothetical protein
MKSCLSWLLSIVARECTVISGKAAQIVIGYAAQSPSSAILHNPRLAPTSY